MGPDRVWAVDAVVGFGPPAPGGSPVDPARVPTLAPGAARRRLGGTPWEPDPAADPIAITVGGAAVPGTRREASRRRRRRRSRPWFRRPVLVTPLALLAVAVVAVGALAVRAGATLATVRSVNVPGPTVSGEALGGDAGVSVDTSAAREATGVEEDEGGLWDDFRDAASGVADVAEGAAVAVGIEEAPAEAVTILLMGVDARPGEPIDVSVRPDALMVLHLNPEAGTCRMLSVPRDTRTELPGYGLSKVNNALVVGGIPYQRQVVEGLLGIELDHYALIDFAGYQELVDAVGGVRVDVTRAFEAGGMAFETGPTTLDGKRALAYARYRAAPDHDVGRVRRQQQILRGLVEAAAGRDVARDVDELLPALGSHVRTDLSPSEMVGLAEQYRDTCRDDRLAVGELRGVLMKLDDPMLRAPQIYHIVEEAEVRRKVAELQGGDERVATGD
jgi:polyisoprenyl-teichoic acid--peptidoglycan teichoic acid transferase